MQHYPRSPWKIITFIKQSRVKIAVSNCIFAKLLSVVLEAGEDIVIKNSQCSGAQFPAPTSDSSQPLTVTATPRIWHPPLPSTGTYMHMLRHTDTYIYFFPKSLNGALINIRWILILASTLYTEPSYFGWIFIKAILLKNRNEIINDDVVTFPREYIKVQSIISS